MNILHVTPYYPPAYPFGGVVRAVEGMARALTRRGHSVTVLTTDALSRTSTYAGAFDKVTDGVRVVRAHNLLLFLRARYNLSTPLAMRKLAPDLAAWADVIHLHEFRTAENVIVTPAAESLGKPIVMSPHGTLTLSAGETGLKRMWDQSISPTIARRIGGVIGLTDAETAEARGLWKAFGTPSAHTHFFTVPNGVDADEFAALTGGAEFRSEYGLGDAPIVLFLGRLHVRKGVEVLVEAFKQVDVPGARLVIAGPDEGLMAGLRIEAKQNPSLWLTGYLDAESRKAALAAADVFVLPALAGEGLPITALEALAAGVPSILSPACALPEVADAGAGLIVPPEPEALAAAIRELLNDPARRAMISTNARRLIRERFTWERAAEQLEHIYDAARIGYP